MTQYPYHSPASAHSLTSRLYETEQNLEAMQGLLMEARSQTDDWRYWHVGDLTRRLPKGLMTPHATKRHRHSTGLLPGGRPELTAW